VANAKEGEQKKNIAAQKLAALQAVLPKDRAADLEKQRRQAEQDWATLNNAMQDTQYVPKAEILAFIHRLPSPY